MNDHVFKKILRIVEQTSFTVYPNHYPPLTSWDSLDNDVIIRPGWRKTLKRNEPLGLYVHMPFCPSKCSFCYLPVLVTGNLSLINTYLDALEIEAELLSPVFAGREFDCVYVGGGTPSMMDSNQFERFFKILKKFFNSKRGAQIGLEANPEFLDLARVRGLKENGVNWLSLGVQSLDDGVISKTRRRQTNPRVKEVYSLCRKAGIEGINVDLICGLEGQTGESFLKDVKTVASWRPDQIHLYRFFPTASTAYVRRGGRFSAEDIRYWSGLRETGLGILAGKGYQRMDCESAGLALESRNRQASRAFYLGSSILGLGPGAVSHARWALRYQNTENIPDYYRRLSDGKLPVARGRRIGRKEEMINFALNSLEHEERISLKVFRDVFGGELEKVFSRPLKYLLNNGVLERNDDCFRVKDPGRTVFECSKAFFEKAVVDRVIGKYRLKS